MQQNPVMSAISSVFWDALIPCFQSMTGDQCCQEAIFDDVRFVVNQALDGYNGTIMGRSHVVHLQQLSSEMRLLKIGQVETYNMTLSDMYLATNLGMALIDSTNHQWAWDTCKLCCPPATFDFSRQRHQWNISFSFKYSQLKFAWANIIMHKVGKSSVQAFIDIAVP